MADEPRWRTPPETSQLGFASDRYLDTADLQGDGLRRLRSELAQARQDYLVGNHAAVLSRLERYASGASRPSATTASALVILGRSLAALGRGDESQHLLQEAVTQFGREAGLRGQELSDYGIALYMTGRTEQAVMALGRALRQEGAQPPDTYQFLGLALMADGKYQQAEQPLRSAVELAPANPGPREALADVLRKQGRLSEASAQLAEGAATLAAAGHVAEALKLCADAVSLRPDDPGLLGLESEILAALGRYQEALNAAERALAQRPDSVPLLGAKGQALQMLGRYEDALPVLRRAAELDPGAAGLQRELAETLRMLGRYQDALAALDKALELEPDSAWALGAKGLVLRMLGRYDGALPVLRRAAELDPSLGWVHAELAIVYAATGRVKEARAVVDRALALDPGNWSALVIKGQLLNAAGDYQAALAATDRVLAVSPGDVTAIRTKAEALRGLERHQDALMLLERAIELKPADTSLLWAKALQLWAAAMFDEVLQILGAIGETQLLTPVMQGVKGFSLLYLRPDRAAPDRAAEARRAFEAAVAADASRLSWQVGLAEAMRLVRDPAARSQYERCIRDADERGYADARSLSSVGWCQYRLGHYVDAARLFTQSVSLAPADADKQFNLALALLCGGQGPLAAEEYDRGFKMVAGKADPLRRRGLLTIASCDLKEAIAERDNPWPSRDGDEPGGATPEARENTDLWQSLSSQFDAKLAAVESELKPLVR